MVAAAIYPENLTIGFSLKILGSGARTTIIDGGAVNSVVTLPNSNSRVTVSKVTIRNGVAPSCGGIYNSGTLTVSNSTFSGNVATGMGSIFYFGGGICNIVGAALTINNSTFSGNFAGGNGISEGGGIFSNGKLTINNSTFSGNSAGTFAGGIAIETDGMLTINNSTVSGNSAGIDGGGIANDGTITMNNSTISGNTVSLGGGGGISSAGTLTINSSTISGNSAQAGGAIGGTATLQNSIVANSPSGGNCLGQITSNGYNLSSDNTCNFNNSGDLNNTDPKLGQLGNYGGPTQTIPLLSGTPAIDTGNPIGCTDGHGHLLKTDQRGKPRPDKEDTSGCDRGAYERQQD